MSKAIMIAGHQVIFTLMFEDVVNAWVDHLVTTNAIKEGEEAAAAQSNFSRDVIGAIEFLAANPELTKKLWWEGKLVYDEDPLDLHFNEKSLIEDNESFSDIKNYHFGEYNPEDIITVPNIIKVVGSVYPSKEISVSVLVDPEDKFKGAHTYFINRMTGLDGTEAVYDRGFEGRDILEFVKRNDDGTWKEGWQSEQLVLALLDRTAKLNTVFPSPQNEKMMAGLQQFLDACKERVDDRIERGVMGKHEK